MDWLDWTIVYAIIGIVIAEIGMRAMRREKRPFSAGAYVCALTLWPVVLLGAVVATVRGG